MWDVMEKDISYSNKPDGELHCIEKVDVKVRNVADSEIDMFATLIDSLNHHYLSERIIHIGTGRKDFILTVQNCELASLKEAIGILLKIVKPERITLDT